MKEHKISDFELNLKPELAKKVATTYKTLEILRDSSVNTIMTDLEITRTAAGKLHKFVVELLADLEKQTGEAIHTKVDRDLVTARNQESKPPAPDISDMEDQERYITVEQRVDKFNTIRKRILITPGVCVQCGFDIISANRLVPFNDLSDSDKSKVRAALKRHIEEEHNPSEQKIVTKAELGASSWLHPAG